jgi:hypothetical protein
MPDLTAAIDENAATRIIHAAESQLGTITRSASSAIGPFAATGTLHAQLSGGNVHLIPPDVIRVASVTLSYSVQLAFALDVNQFLAPLHVGPWTIQIKIGWFEFTFTIPGFTVNWPTVTVPIAFSNAIAVGADFKLSTHLVAARWKVDLVAFGVPSLNVSAAGAIALAAVGAGLTVALSAIPGIEPFLTSTIAAIQGTIALTGATSLVAAILTPLVAGLTVTIYDQPRRFQVLAAKSPIDPAVFIDLAQVETRVIANSDEPELVLTAVFA